MLSLLKETLTGLNLIADSSSQIRHMFPHHQIFRSLYSGGGEDGWISSGVDPGCVTGSSKSAYNLYFCFVRLRKCG